MCLKPSRSSIYKYFNESLKSHCEVIHSAVECLLSDTTGTRLFYFNKRSFAICQSVTRVLPLRIRTKIVVIHLLSCINFTTYISPNSLKFASLRWNKKLMVYLKQSECKIHLDFYDFPQFVIVSPLISNSTAVFKVTHLNCVF